MTAEQYGEIIRRLEEAGQGTPNGRLYHVCYGSDNQLRVLDVWESPETFQQFGQTLVPIIQQVGVEVDGPEVYPVTNVIKG